MRACGSVCVCEGRGILSIFFFFPPGIEYILESNTDMIFSIIL